MLQNERNTKNITPSVVIKCLDLRKESYTAKWLKLSQLSESTRSLKTQNSWQERACCCLCPQHSTFSCQQCKSNKLHLLISAAVFKVAADYCLNLNSLLPANNIFVHVRAHFGSVFARTFGTVKRIMDAMTNQTGFPQATCEDN